MRTTKVSRETRFCFGHLASSGLSRLSAAPVAAVTAAVVEPSLSVGVTEAEALSARNISAVISLLSSLIRCAEGARESVEPSGANRLEVATGKSVAGSSHLEVCQIVRILLDQV